MSKKYVLYAGSTKDAIYNLKIVEEGEKVDILRGTEIVEEDFNEFKAKLVKLANDEIAYLNAGIIHAKNALLLFENLEEENILN